MKALKYSLMVVLVAGVVVSTAMLLTRSPRTQTTEANEATQADQQSQPAEPNEPVIDSPVPLAPVPVRKLAAEVPLTPAQPGVPVVEIASPSANTMRVRADQVLATVNEQAISLKHLLPLQPDEQERAMTSEEYESRLNRAIEMELTFQAAAARRVDLTPQQRRRVEGVAQKHEAALQEYRKQGVTWSSVTATQVEFEQRLTAALLLQQNLVAKEAPVAPASDPKVQARYEQARGEVLRRFKAASNIITPTAEL